MITFLQLVIRRSSETVRLAAARDAAKQALYDGRGWIATNAASGRMRGVLQSDALHVVERFTRVGANTIHSQATIDDPTTYTRPWTLAIPLERDDQDQLFEYACHEGNHSVENMLRAARVAEAAKNR